MKQLLFLGLLTFSLFSCGTSPNGCRMGKPQAMFSANLEGISNHKFELKENNESVESFDFGGSPVIIYQTGCDEVAQEFQFNFSNKTGKTGEGMIKIANILTAWSKLGEKQLNFAQWGKQIRMISREMQFGQTFDAAGNIEIGLDRINKMNGETIVMTLAQKS